MKYTPEKITELEPNQIFVFGANEAGVHGAGAARQALKWGAKMGQIGPNGQTYGLPTKDKHIKTLPLPRIRTYINIFLAYAKYKPDAEFLVTKIGCGLAGYTEKDIGPLFMEYFLPPNVILPFEFSRVDDTTHDAYWLGKF